MRNVRIEVKDVITLVDNSYYMVGSLKARSQVHENLIHHVDLCTFWIEFVTHFTLGIKTI